MDWTTLTASKSTAGSLANWVNRSDLPTTEIVTEAQAWVYQRLRVREMIARTTFTFDADASTEALPTSPRFLDPISFKPFEWSDPLPFLHEEKFTDPRDEDGNLFDGTPSQWTIVGETAYVDVSCEDAFGGILLYYGQPTALSVSNTTNFLTDRYPRLLRQTCMAMAYEHMKDNERAVGYMQAAEADIVEAMRTNEMFRRGQYVPA